MSNFGGAARGRRLTVPTPASGRQIAAYGTYAGAQRAVDFLSDNHFPVQHVTIVGTDLQMVERVTGRLTYGRVAMAGAASGAWFGLFVGLLLSLFATGAGLAGTVLPALVIGAGFGILFGVLCYSFTGGRRDFTSTSQVVAQQYAVLCAPEHAADAAQALSRLPDDGSSRVPESSEPPRSHSPSQQQPYDQQSTAQQSSTQPPVAPAAQRPAGQQTAPSGTQTGEQQPAPTGPTYSEMIAKQRAEREARERGEDPPA